MHKNKAYLLLWLARGSIVQVILDPIGVWECLKGEEASGEGILNLKQAFYYLYFKKSLTSWTLWVLWKHEAVCMHLFCHNTTCRINAWKSQPCSFAGIRHCLNMWKHFTHSVFFLVYFILFWIWVVVFGEQGQSLSDMSQCMRPLNINIGHFRFQGFILFPFKLAKSLLLWVAWFCLNSINQSQRSEILLCVPQVASRSSLLDFCRFIQGYFFSRDHFVCIVLWSCLYFT